MSKLILVRHGISEWNALGLWTGWNDVSLTDEGKEEARKAGEAIREMHIDVVFTSDLVRAQQTYSEIKNVLRLKDVSEYIAPEIKERNYGDLAGKNKWKVKEEYGEEQFMKWRRSWDYPIPNGESLKDVYARVIPYYSSTIKPLLVSGKNILMCAHGNSIRALVKYLENIPDDQIAQLEIGTGEVYIYTLNEKGEVASKEIRSSNPKVGKV